MLGYAVYRSSGMIEGASFSGAKLLAAVRGANPYLLLLSVCAIYACYALRALRWKLFQQNLGKSRFAPIYAMTLAGFAAIFLLGRAGEPVRPLLLARKQNLPIASITGIYALERIFDLISAAVIAGMALLLEKRHVPVASATGAVLIAAVVLGVAFLAYVRLHGSTAVDRPTENWRRLGGWRAKAAEILRGFVRGIQMIRSWSELGLAVVYSAVHWWLVLLVYLWVSHSFGGKFAQMDTGDGMLLMAFTLAGSVFQLPLAGGGSQLAAISVYKFFGIENEPATAAAIVVWLVTFAACSLAGVPLLIREGMSLGELRQLAEREKEAAGGAAAPEGDSAQ